MRAKTFALPSRGNSTKAWEISSLISILLHGLALCAFSFSIPFNTAKPQEEKSVTIELEMVAQTAKPKETPPLAQQETPPTPKEDPAPVKSKPQPTPKKTVAPKPEKVVTRKAEIHIKPTAQRVVKNDLAASKTPKQETRVTSAPARPPAQLGAAFSPPPPYPELARKRGQEGTVNVRCNVDAQGKVISVSLAKSSGFKLLDEAALKTVGKWNFRPAEKDGAKVAGTIIVPVLFKLQ